MICSASQQRADRKMKALGDADAGLLTGYICCSMPKYHSSGLSNVPADFTPMAVQNLPWKFTDDDLISVPIPVSVDSAAAADNAADQVESKGWGSRLKQAMKGKRSPPKMKMVKMTRGEYLKYWARDEQGNYIGTEPEGMGEKLWKNK